MGVREGGKYTESYLARKVIVKKKYIAKLIFQDPVFVLTVVAGGNGLLT